jgi:hypothetical protein
MATFPVKSNAAQFLRIPAYFFEVLITGHSLTTSPGVNGRRATKDDTAVIIIFAATTTP